LPEIGPNMVMFKCPLPIENLMDEAQKEESKE
jgi:hypothetical protein